MEPLRIHLFGGFLLERGGMALPPIASRAGRSLFAYLVMHRERPLQRELLAGTFWPDLPEGRARRRLSHTLWQIQDVVNTEEGSHLDIRPDTLAFNPSLPYWLDVEEFDHNSVTRAKEQRSHVRSDGIDAATLRSCVDLYRGDFLAGYFDDWVLVEQDIYRQRYLTALRRLVDVTKAEGAYEEALSLARRLTHHDPLREDAHQEVMRLSFILGRATDAIEQFERVRSVLEEELGTEPSAPTIEIYDKIMRHRRAGIRPIIEGARPIGLARRPDSPFVGRDEERRLLIDSLERVLAGEGGVVLVEGEPGVGKTRLTNEAAEDARWRGFEVSWGSCHLGAMQPFAPLIEVLESLTPLRAEQLSAQVAPVWLGEMIRLAPGFAGDVDDAGGSHLRPADESTRTREALIHTLGALGRIAPHLIVIDDVQWADQDTLAVLTRMGSRLAASRVLLVLLFRSEEARGDAEVWDVMRDLDRSAGLGRIVLSPLSVFELDEMVRRVLGVARLNPGVAAHLHRHTGGNVLFTLETLLAMRDRGLFEGGSDPVRVLQDELAAQNVPVAPRVRTVIEDRMSLLGEEATEVFELAAVLGDGAGLALLDQIVEIPRASVLDAVDELLYRGLLRDDGSGRYRVAHDQVRQVVYERIAPSARKRLHELVGEALARSEPDRVEAIGHHFKEGDEPARATTFLHKAGLRAIGLNAYATARHQLRSALETSRSAALTDSARYRLLGDLEEVLNVLGGRSEQEEVIAEMTDLASGLPEVKGDLERRRAWLFAQAGRMQEAVASALVAVEAEGDRGEADAVATSLVALGTIQRWSGRPLEAVPNLERAVEAAIDERRRADALTELASTLIEVQQPEIALAHLAEAESIYTAVDDIRGRAEVAGIQARAFRLDGDRDRAASRYRLAIDLCRQIGYRHGEGVNLTNLSNLHQLLGGVAEALDGYDRSARIFAELGNLRGEATVLVNAASARHHLLGDDDRAHSDAIRAMGHFREIGDRAREAQCQEVVAGVAARAGRRDEARRLLVASLAALEGSGDVVLEGQHLRSLALLALEDGDIATATAALDRADALCADAGLADLAVDLISIRGMAHLAAGRVAEALGCTRAAVSRLAPGVERPYLIHLRHALAAGHAGEEVEARRAGLEAESGLASALAGLDPETLALALQAVPEHRRIHEAASRHAPHTIQVRLPVAEAPTGKSLQATEMRWVTWTLDHPDDLQIESGIGRRRARVARLLTEAGKAGTVPSTEQLANALAVSASTVRRDLEVLRADGHPATTRGQRRRVS